MIRFVIPDDRVPLEIGAFFAHCHPTMMFVHVPEYAKIMYVWTHLPLGLMVWIALLKTCSGPRPMVPIKPSNSFLSWGCFTSFTCFHTNSFITIYGVTCAPYSPVPRLIFVVTELYVNPFRPGHRHRQPDEGDQRQNLRYDLKKNFNVSFQFINIIKV